MNRWHLNFWELNIQEDSIPDLNYTGVNGTARNMEKFTVVCLYNSPSVNKTGFLGSV